MGCSIQKKGGTRRTGGVGQQKIAGVKEEKGGKQREKGEKKKGRGRVPKHCMSLDSMVTGKCAAHHTSRLINLLDAGTTLMSAANAETQK